MEIKTVLFDLGGVIITLDQSQAIRRFEELGVPDAAQRLDPYQQSGIFGQLEEGLISAEDFRRELSKLVGYEVTMDQCEYAWQGYAKEVPQRNLDALRRLHEEGYRVLLLSNYYFDACYLSYQMKMMKPSELIFREVLRREKTFASQVLFVDDGPRNVMVASQLGMRTYCPENGADWTEKIYDYLKEE